MTAFGQRRRFLGMAAGGALSVCGALSACGTVGSGIGARALGADRIDDALAQLDRLAGELMASSGVPGMAVAVVRGDRSVYAKGFGTRRIGVHAPVDADTVFQLASVSKSVGATVVAREVGLGSVSWDTPMRDRLPWFALSNPAVTRELAISDLYSHRSGLPDHAGDLLEDMGYDQREVLERLRFLPLSAFRTTYHYTNFGLTAAALAVSEASGADWATLSERAIYAPLGMTRSSSRYQDFAARPNRVTGHLLAEGKWVPGPVRMPDAQAPAASVTSSVNDMAKWLTMMLGDGTYAGRRIVDAGALAPALSPQIESTPAGNGRPAGHYGYGFNVGSTPAGHRTYGHSGGFYLGAGTAFKVVPAMGLAMVALTNGSPMGVPEALIAQFFDLAESGAIRQDWPRIYGQAFAPYIDPEGSLVGVAPPAAPTPPPALAALAGRYANDYYGPLDVLLQSRPDSLLLTLGRTPLRLALAHRDGDVFTFALLNENAPMGSISKASFAAGSVTLEYYDKDGLGTWKR